jgi:cytoskeleton protein RodZ
MVTTDAFNHRRSPVSFRYRVENPTGGVVVPREAASLKKANGAELSKERTMFGGEAEVPDAGAELRAARERLGWALSDVAAMLRIRPTYLEALEAGRLNNLPGRVYALGFLRGYAGSLGLDPEEMVRRFRAETSELAKQPDLTFPAPMAERGFPAGALILLGLLLVGGAYAGWYHLSGEGKLPAETVTPVPARLAGLAGQAVPGPDGRIPVPAMPPNVSATASAAGGQTMATPSGQATAPTREASTKTPGVAPTPAPGSVEETQASPMINATPTTAIAMPAHPPGPDPRTAPPPVSPADVTKPDAPRILLRFTGDTWVQVKEHGGPTLVSKLMKAGDSFEVPARPNLFLTTGNAGRVEVVVDGTVAPSIGGPGAVRRDIPLDPDELKAGTATPVASRH